MSSSSMQSDAATGVGRLKFCGVVHPNSKFHILREKAPEDHVIAPNYVFVEGVGSVPQYAPTVFGKSTAYDPPHDCKGYFMSAKYQPNNNCYAYGCVIASNSFPQPGRLNGYTLPKKFTGSDVAYGAELDGLSMVGQTLEAVYSHAKDEAPGHYVALLISEADPGIGWTGDYHWVRCDDLTTSMWSQKDGSDQVTDFDFAGNPITDPATANWTVNQGPISKTDIREMVVSYDFYAYMFVPRDGVDII
ncbi:hypothetical protein [Desulfoluna butyratoxydans]|uniref:Uncharacterized protein n=1 Tax=Desulfoluna butyratoxydans TaxID=231438 RepID=A0A4V6ILC4_9BACT|nr:hypothetical protein [Desulfoluna butyratoxydans]VFQ44608.1 hypothetical protein MSL71_22570 [Desulfoluna butyratoxydans]